MLHRLWLIIAPFAFRGAGVHPAWAANDVIVGILLVGFSWWILGAVAAPAGAAWVEMLCGVWLIFAPFVLQYGGATAAVANDVLCGIIAIVVAAAASRERTRSIA